MGNNKPASGRIFKILTSFKTGDTVTKDAVLKKASEVGEKFTDAQVTSFLAKLAIDKSLGKTERRGVYVVKPRMFGYGKRHPFREYYNRGGDKKLVKTAPITPISSSVAVIDALLTVMAEAEPVLKQCKSTMEELEDAKVAIEHQRKIMASQGQKIDQFRTKLAELKKL